MKRKIEAGLNVVGKALARASSILAPSTGGGGWSPIIREYDSGFWQRNIEYTSEDITSYSAVFACLSLIASDLAKLPIKGIRFGKSVWQQLDNTDIERFFERPNPSQNRIQFIENWILSKLTHGNTYVLVQRDGAGKVKALRVLDPHKVQPQVTESGAVYYQLGADNVTGIGESVLVPASEIIHDRANCLFHPLVGISPLWACAVAAGQGLAIQRTSTKFFANGSVATGILTAPGAISDTNADQLKKHWEDQYSGEKGVGKIAVLGDGLKFERAALTSADSQLIEQLKWTVEVVCMAFKVPPYMIGYGDPPAYGNIQAANQQYYAQCLQILIESFELCIDQGFELGQLDGVEMDVGVLLRMDSKTQMEVLSAGTKGGLLKPDEARKELGREPVEGGDTIYMQEQNYSLAALAKRDAMPDPWRRNNAPAAVAAPAPSVGRKKAVLTGEAFEQALDLIGEALERHSPTLRDNVMGTLAQTFAAEAKAA